MGSSRTDRDGLCGLCLDLSRRHVEEGKQSRPRRPPWGGGARLSRPFPAATSDKMTRLPQVGTLEVQACRIGPGVGFFFFSPSLVQKGYPSLGVVCMYIIHLDHYGPDIRTRDWISAEQVSPPRVECVHSTYLTYVSSLSWGTYVHRPTAEMIVCMSKAAGAPYL